MSKPEDSPRDPELPELQPLVAAVDCLARERKKLEEAILAIRSGQSKKALQKLTQLEKQAQKADTELRTCLAHLKLYFGILWIKSGLTKPPLALVTDVIELVQLFGIEDINQVSVFDDPEDVLLAEKIVAKVRQNLDAEKRIGSAKAVADQLVKLAKAADRKGFDYRAALMNATASFVLLGMEDIAGRQLLPLLRLIKETDRDGGVFGPN